MDETAKQKFQPQLSIETRMILNKSNDKIINSNTQKQKQV